MLTSAVYSDKLRDKFQEWLADNKLKPLDVAKACRRRVSVSTWNVFRDEGYVSKNTIEVLCDTYPNEDRDEWLSLFEQEQNGEAA